MPLSNDKSLEDLVRCVQLGEQGAYEKVIRSFQDMAVGYSYAILGDLHLAEDAAQEAFIQAYYDLPELRNPAAFPGWFRRIVFTQINRLQRAKKVNSVPLGLIIETEPAGPTPVEVVEQREVRDQVWAAITTLPEHQRTVVTLFYMNQYSQKEISAFLEIPVATVKTRLYAARKQLKERMVKVLQDYLIEHRPSKNEAFVKEMKMNLALAKVVSCGAAGCQVRLIENDELLDTRYALNIQDQITIRPEQLVVVDKRPTSSQTVYRLYLSQVIEIGGDHLRVELLRDEGDRGKGHYFQASLAEGLDLALKVGDDVYGRDIIFGLARNGRPADPEQLLATLTPLIEAIYVGDTFQLDPQSAAAHTNRGNVQLDGGEYDQAIAAYTQALTVNPRYVVAYTNRGHAYKAKGDKVRARADYERVIALLENPTPDILPDNHPIWRQADMPAAGQKNIKTRLVRAKKHLAALETAGT